MNNYIVAKSYQSAERIGEPFKKNNKLYQKIKEKCPRCGGLGIIVARVENNQPIPIPVNQGICYKCAGNKYIYKEIRLYTEKEFNSMTAANERAKEKKEVERRAKMEAEFAEKKANWLKKNGFNAEGETYVVTGDSYSIKDELKALGFKFDYTLFWHKEEPAGYEDRTIKVKVEDVIDFSAWGEGHYKTEAKDFIKKLTQPAEEESNSEWVGEVGNKISRLEVTLVKKGGFYGNWGWSNIYSFKDAEDNIINWFTTKEIEFAVDEKCFLTATVKKHDTYKGVKQTIVTRAKLEKD